MKTPFTSAQRLSLRSNILDAGCLLESEKEDLIVAIESWLEDEEKKQSYSERIIELNSVSKRCSECGKLDIVYYKPFDKSLIPLLQTYAYAGEPLNNVMLADKYVEASREGKVLFWAKKKSGYAPALRWWGLIRIVGEDKQRNAFYEITELGRQCVNDFSTLIPDHVWTYEDGDGTNRVDAPEGTQHTHPIQMVSIEEILKRPRQKRSKSWLVDHGISHS